MTRCLRPTAIPSTPRSLPDSSASTQSRCEPCYASATSCRGTSSTRNTESTGIPSRRFGVTQTCKDSRGFRVARKNTSTALGLVSEHIARNSLVAVARILGPGRRVAAFSPGREVAVAGPSGVLRGTRALVCVSHFGGWAFALLKMLGTDDFLVLEALTQFVANKVHPVTLLREPTRRVEPLALVRARRTTWRGSSGRRGAGRAQARARGAGRAPIRA
jgi:hypothetical protein